MTLIEGLPEELRLDKEDDLGQYTQNIKGQLISKGLFGVFKSTKKTNKNFVRISALAFKKRSNQKSSVESQNEIIQLVV